MEPRKTRGLKAVAAELGVSAMTVSNAYNRPDQLSAALRAEILETARRLGYPGPDPLARGLKRGRTGALGLVYDTRLSYAVRDPAAAAFLEGVCGAAEASGLGLLLVPGSEPEQRDARPVSAALVDGLIVYSVAEGDAIVAAAGARAMPAVTVDQPRMPGVAHVGIDDWLAAREAAAHLVGLGHRRFAVLSFALSPDGRTGPAGPARRRDAGYPVSAARMAGYQDALAEGAISWSEVPVHECAGSGMDLGRAGARALLDAEPRPTALLATSDELALGAIETARELGLSVPDQLSVAGFDDVPAASERSPALTTVSQDHARKGRLATEVLLAQLAGNAGAEHHELPHRLVVRASTGPAP
jgi:DNA-binding LacI/PurR family transcriptional regulator